MNTTLCLFDETIFYNMTNIPWVSYCIFCEFNSLTTLCVCLSSYTRAQVYTHSTHSLNRYVSLSQSHLHIHTHTHACLSLTSPYTHTPLSHTHMHTPFTLPLTKYVFIRTCHVLVTPISLLSLFLSLPSNHY